MPPGTVILYISPVTFNLRQSKETINDIQTQKDASPYWKDLVSTP